MLRPRVIPCLLIQGGGLVKTQRFTSAKYVGDPINAVRIFSEKNADEILILDIDATAKGAEPDYELIAKVATECQMPLCYGGGVKSVSQARKIIRLGVEKVAFSAAALADPSLVTEARRALGSQSVVVVVDVMRIHGAATPQYEVRTHNGQRLHGTDLPGVLRSMESAGAGEIVVNSIDRDGCMNGYDLDLARLVRGAVSVPVTLLGGAGSLGDMAELVGACGVVGLAAGSLFVFKGRYRAVLLSYPSAVQKEELFTHAGSWLNRHPDRLA
jgi:imidazole glycerol-phosphate synthase subunit HisF